MECRNGMNDKEGNCRHQCRDLPAGKTSAECIHVECCTTFFGSEPDSLKSSKKSRKVFHF